MRWSKALLPTMKDSPKDAEVISHILMARAGLIRKVGSGLYEYLPAGQNVLLKLEKIIREELAKVDMQEILMPILAPSELWEESGRRFAYGKEMMVVRDRHDHDYILCPTHEETVTDLARREIRSYKQLPFAVYHIQLKFRDEVRPRFGVMRSREFIMKDGYSFHTSQEDLERYYAIVCEAYKKIFKRAGLDTRVVIGHSGAIGGKVAHELMVLAKTGESLILSCSDPECGYTATDETSDGTILDLPQEPNDKPIEKVATPHMNTIEKLAEFLKLKQSQTIKATLFDCDGKLVIVFIRGDREVNEAKLSRLTGCAPQLAGDKLLENFKGKVAPGFCGPIGLDKVEGLTVYFDNTVRNLVGAATGANEEGYHYVNVTPARDLPWAEYTDLAVMVEGDLCPKCGKPMTECRGIEVGNIFQLGTKYSSAMGATYSDENNNEKPFIMGCYGLGVGRTVAAAVESCHDEFGIKWPKAIAPYDMVVQILDLGDEAVVKKAEELYEALKEKGYSVILDDRDQKPGFKFKDSDLIGFPVRVTIGSKNLSNGMVEVKRRCDEGKGALIPAESALSEIEKIYETCP